MGWQAQYQEEYAQGGVTISRLLNPRREYDHKERRAYDDRPTGMFDQAIDDNIRSNARRNPGDDNADWTVHEVGGMGYSTDYVPMNSAARSRLMSGGYIGTGNLAGCVALGAAYRDGKYVVPLMAHYDPENVRQTNENGELRLSAMLRDFAGAQAVKVTLAYGSSMESHLEAPAGYKAEEYPIASLVDTFKTLPSGSHALLLPYDARGDDIGYRQFWEENQPGNTFFVGDRGGIMHGWNGHTLAYGESDIPDAGYDRRLRAALAPIIEDLERDAGFAYDLE